MKKKLLILFLCFISFAGLQAQTITWTGAVNDLYNNPNNWNPAQVPTAANDVIIPTGSTMIINVAASVKSIKVQGTSTVTINNNLQFTHASSFSSNTTVYWNNSSLYGGGTLTNNGTVNLTTAGSRYISGPTTINNNGLFTMPAGGYLYLYDTSVFNNTVSGTFDLQSDARISYDGNTHNFFNAGLFKKTGGMGSSNIYVVFTNTGTISVESGTIDMYYFPKYFNGGVYNVSSGAVLEVSTTGMNVSGTLTGTLDGPLNWTGNFSVASTATFNFTGNTGVTWTAGSLLGGGNLTNESNISLVGAGSRYISGATTLTNNGVITMPGGGYLYLYDTSVVNNTPLGVYDLQSDARISYDGNTHSFINAGTFKKTGGTDTSYIYVVFTNTGTISVESGTIDMYYYSKYFNGGIYNVSSGSALEVSTTGMNVSGTLTGTLDGPLNWTGNFSVASTATFDFTGDTGVNWKSGSLLGGGTLVNESTINFDTAGSRYISGSVTTLKNLGILNFPSGGYLYLYDDTTLDNQAAGVIDFQSDARISYNGSGAYSIINAGTLKKTAGNGTTYIYPPVTNSGVINSMSGELEFRDGFGLNNTVDGIIKGTASIDLPAPANFTNDGTFAPGGSPGTLTVLGTYKSTSSSVLNVELDGLVPGTEYDQLVITGTNAVFEGTVNVDLGFEANVGDAFTIATVSGVIDTKNLSSPVFSVYGCREYTFNISYPNDKSVVLTISNKGDVLPPTVMTQNITVQLDSNGEVSITPEQIDNGSGAGCTEGGELTFSLDRTDFTCSDLGDNTVILTVTDENENSSSGTAIVTVEDDTEPTVMVQNITVELDASGSVTISPSDIDNGSFDNCTIASLTLDINTFGCSNIGTNNVIFTAEDQSGNVTTVNATVTVTDPLGTCNEAPVAVCQALIVNSNADCQADASAQAFDGGSTDPNGLPLTFTVEPMGPYNVGITEVTLTVSNGTDSDSCTTTITVEDITPPLANCAAPFTVQLDANGQASISVANIDNGSSDNCGIASTTIDITDFSCGNIGDNTITLTVTDISGNVSTCATVVTVTDPLGACNEAPTAVCQAITVSADFNCWGNATAEDFDGGSTDPNGSPLTFSVDPVGPYIVGTTNVTLTVSNGTSSDSCTTTITVVDDTPPIASCSAPFTVQLDSDGNASISVADIDNGSYDNCGMASMELDIDSFDCSDVGENDVTLTVTDQSGNISSCTTVVTVEDSLAPIVVAQNITVQLDVNGNATIFPENIDNGSSDNCGIADMTIDRDSFGCSDIGANQVILTVVDNNGNQTYAAATVTVEDPLLACGTTNPGDYFVTTWRTTAANETITVPTNPAATYSYSVDWGDGTSVSGITGDASHSYASPGIHTVKIDGLFPQIYFNNGGDAMKLMSIEQWGTNSWTSMRAAFAGCGNLVSNATDMPDLSMVTNMYGMFAYARKFNGDSEIGNWNVGNVTNMYGTFAGASVFNADIKGWNVGNVTTMENMFYGATLFNRNLSDWNVSNVTTMKFMFATAMKFNGVITNWDVSNVTDMNSMFYHANSFDQDLGNWDVSNVTNMNNMFRNVTLSTYNYDSLLMGWSSLPLKNNVGFNAGFSKYCTGEDARRYIIDSYNWSIADGGLQCPDAFQKPGMESQAPLSGVSLYPNPMTDRLHVGNPKNVPLEKIEIFDLTGRLLRSTGLEGMRSIAEVDVSLLSSATYVVVVTANNGKLTQFFIKE